MYRLEADLLEAIRKKTKVSHAECIENSKARLRRSVGRNGDNLYDLLVRLISKLLDNPPSAVDLFEEYCRLAKAEFLLPDHRRSFAVPNQKQIMLAKRTLDALNQIESGRSRCRQELNPLFLHELNSMGYTLPYGFDYFISSEMDRMVRSDENVKFWGVMRSLGCDYFVLELEHSEKSMEGTINRNGTERSSEMISEIISALLEASTARASTEDLSEKASCEMEDSVENVTLTTILNVLGRLELIDSEVELEYCRNDIDHLLSELIDGLYGIAPGKKESWSSLGDGSILDRHDHSAASTETLLRFRLERLQLEGRLNSHSFLVSEDPSTRSWYRLPDVTLKQLEGTECMRRFLTGNLKSTVRGKTDVFWGLEENLLRVLIAKITAHRDGNIEGSETNLALLKNMCGTFGSKIGYDHELGHDHADRWHERNELGMQYWASENWPGLCAFSTGFHFRGCYFGWGLENQKYWHNSVVRIPSIMKEYDNGQTTCGHQVNQTHYSRYDL
ncbi:uncharacterized protein LOC131207847 [Anopheles bellator]|uniref:uncharacterized protein LOC131207847 n=1 Tax=Anopheles bellator TaxID=139047 RepID=UPI00264A488B|nr:uncharacterized protein LOC131207847 [Anopheles bellator]